MSEIELKACPFCGSPDDCLIIEWMEGTTIRPAYRVYCDFCGASTGFTDRGDHKDQWNSRSSQWQPIDTVPRRAVVLATSTEIKGPNGEPVVWAAVFDKSLDKLVSTSDGETLYKATHWRTMLEMPEIKE